MLELKASRFCQSALQSGLIDEAGLAACFDLIPPEKRTPDAIDRRLARQTIATGRLTLWQAQQVLGGRSTGYKVDNRYILLDLLGRGGMGRVYLAKDVRLIRQVALKILSQERMNNPRAIARFQREAKVGAQLQHENLVRVYDQGDDAGIRYLVMEYIEGKNVGQLIGELGSIPWPTAARLGRQIALGLDHARLKELIHRDVNPCNILVTGDGTAKLTDLGLAIDLNDTDNVTRDGATVGTFDYVSPEQARHSRSVDTRADIYSLGCTLYHMIAGRVPFPVASLPEKLYAHQLHEPDPLVEVAPGTPEGLAEVVRKMMRKQADDRYQTPLEVAQALEPYAIESGWTTSSATASPAATDPIPTARPAISTGSDVAARSREAVVKVGVGAGNGNGNGEADVLSSWATNLNLDLGPGSRTPASGSGSGSTGDSFFPVDFGRDEPLFEGLNPPAKSKSRPKADAPPSNDAAAASRMPPRAVVLIAIGSLAAIAVVAMVASLATLALSGPGSAAKGGANPGVDVASKPRPTKKLARGDIVVLYRDGDSESVKTLTEALAMASSRIGAEVILGGGATVRVDNGKTIRVADGGLTLRAADGARPVLEVKVKGSLPMFLVNAGLRLEGLTVVVKYETSSDAPIFQAERELALVRSTFRADGSTDRSRFALAEGRRADVDGCLFEGFDTALDVAANPGMAVSLKGSIFLSSRPGDEAIGRAIRVRSNFGQGASCRLSVEGCSTRAATFLEAGNFSTTSPLDVVAGGSAFLVKSLLAFEGDPKAPIGAEGALRWKGQGNRYKVTGLAWSTFPDAPTSLDAWSKLTGEVDAKAQDLKLAKEPPDPATPKDCALLDEADKPVGADPSKVGPG